MLVQKLKTLVYTGSDRSGTKTEIIIVTKTDKSKFRGRHVYRPGDLLRWLLCVTDVRDEDRRTRKQSDVFQWPVVTEHGQGEGSNLQEILGKKTNWGISKTHTHCLERGKGILKRGKEEKRWEVLECEGWVCDLEDIGAPDYVYGLGYQRFFVKLHSS